METFNPEKVKCPHCDGGLLRPKHDTERVIGYVCPYCSSQFHRTHYYDLENGLVHFLVKRVNPKHMAEINKLQTEDWFKGFMLSERLEKDIPFYAETYDIGTKKLA